MRWFKGAFIGLVIVLIGAVAMVYWSRPLSVSGRGVRLTNESGIVAYTVNNDGRWPIVLRDVKVNGRSALDNARMALNTGGEMAFSAAIEVPPGRHLTYGDVRGWRVGPVKERPSSHGEAALVLSWTPGERAFDSVVVHYSYMGLPMTYTFDTHMLELDVGMSDSDRWDRASMDGAFAVAQDAHTYVVYHSQDGTTRELARLSVPNAGSARPLVKAAPQLDYVGVLPDRFGSGLRLFDTNGRLQWEAEGLFRDFVWDPSGRRMAAIKWDRQGSPEPPQASLVFIDLVGLETEVLAPALERRLSHVVGFTSDGHGLLLTRELSPVGTQFDQGEELVRLDLQTMHESTILSGHKPDGARRLTAFALLHRPDDDVLTYIESTHPRSEDYWLVAADLNGADIARHPVWIEEPFGTIGSYVWADDLERVAWIDPLGVRLSNRYGLMGPPDPWELHTLADDELWAFHRHHGFVVVDTNGPPSQFPVIGEP